MAVLSKLKYYLPESAMFNFYYSLVHWHLNLGLPVCLGNTYSTYLCKLSKIQIKAVKIITGKDREKMLKLVYQKCEILDLTK